MRVLITLLFVVVACNCTNNCGQDDGWEDNFAQAVRDQLVAIGITDPDQLDLLVGEELDDERKNQDVDDISWEDAIGYQECDLFLMPGDAGDNKFTECLKPESLARSCEKTECPPSVDVTPEGSCGFLQRTISAGAWVGVDLVGVSDNPGKAAKDAFAKLFAYQGGNNADSVQMSLTVPLVSLMCVNEMLAVSGGRMYVYIPAELQDAPPAPLDDALSVEQWGEVVYYARVFGGGVPMESANSASAVSMQYELLLASVSEVQLEPFLQYTISLEYNSPVQPRQRHEVGYFAADPQIMQCGA